MWQLSSLTSILATLGAFGISVLGLTGAAYGLFRYLGDKWLTAKFNERLESYKHEQQRQLEQLRYRINTLFDRTVKLHQHEFDVLPELWAKLNEAFGYASSFVSPLQSYPDLDRMTPAHLDDFLAKSDMADFQKDELRSGTDKTRRHMKIRFWYDLNETQRKYSEFNNAFVSKSIFLQREIKAPMQELRDMMYDALSEKKFEEQYQDPRAGRFDKCDTLRKEGPQKLEEIGEKVRERLWSSQVEPTTTARDVLGSS
jgi:hypothetical protein